MKVRTVKTGFYNNRLRFKGEIFLLNDKKYFSPIWMEWMDKPEPIEEEISTPAPKPRGNPMWRKK